MAAELLICVADWGVTVKIPAGPLGRAETQPLPTSATSLAFDELAEAVLAALGRLDASNHTATLVIPSSWCYVHRFEVAQRRPTRTLLAYALEEYLPLEIESLTCDFIRTATGAHIGVAIETERIRPLLDTLASKHIHVEHVTLDVLHAPVAQNQQKCCSGAMTNTWPL